MVGIISGYIKLNIKAYFYRAAFYVRPGNAHEHAQLIQITTDLAELVSDQFIANI